MRLPLSALLALLLLGSPALADDDPPRHSVPETRPIQLDGVPRKAEWEPAVGLRLGEDEGTWLRLQQFRGTLMLALLSDRSWPRRSSLSLFLCPDGPKASADAPGALRIAYEPFEHSRAHAIVYRNGPEGWKRLYQSVVVRHYLTETMSALEMAVPLSVLGLTKDARPALRLCCQWARLGGVSPVWPAGLTLSAPAGQKPPDLANAKRWGRVAAMVC